MKRTYSFHWMIVGLAAVIFLSGAWSARAQTGDTLRIMTYNLLNYPGTNSAMRDPLFRRTLQYMDPDILVVQEMQSAAGVTQFLNNVLNYGQPGTYSAAPFVNGPDTDNALYYRASRVNYISHTILATELRNIDGYRLRPAGIGADSLDIQIYSVHLRASQGFESERFAEADSLRNHLNSLPDGNFVVAGDMNLYTSSEPAYVELTGSQSDNSGRVYDPINTPGNWHSSAGFAAVHTQSTRLSDNGDGGSTGGLDDRFDFALLSYGFQDVVGWQYVSGSYTEVGQDGAHYNQSVNDGVNGAVPDSIADALFTCSDHLPVYFECRRSSDAISTISVLQPNGSELWYTGTAQNILWSSENVGGTVTIKLNRDYPGGSFVPLISGTPDDGLWSWNVTGPVSVTARIQIISDAIPTVSDVSDQNFFIQSPTLEIGIPNGGEEFFVGGPMPMSWQGVGFSGNIRIEIDRAYPSGTWTILYGSAVNDGEETWTATGPTTSTARIRMYSVNQPTVGDTSAADFSIGSAHISIVEPNGGESWPIGSTQIIQWSHGGVSGNIRIELNRSFPSSSWEVLASNVPVENVIEDWVVTGPITNTARIRITLLSDSTKRDSSDGDFQISAAMTPPVIEHDPHADAEPGAVTFTALITDDLPGISAMLFHRLVGAVEYDSLPMPATGFGAEYSASPVFGFGRHEYMIRARDSNSLESATNVLSLMVGEFCGTEIGYDDGNAELFNWSPQDSFEWAVKFTPPGNPFVICGARAFIAAFHPDSTHEPIRIRIYAADGVGGTPGTLLRETTKGSIGNVVGGLDSVEWADEILYDETSEPLEVSSDYFVSVSNLDPGNEAIGIDQGAVVSDRSYVYDPCDDFWIAESSMDSSARGGDRMIRVLGWTKLPPTIVIHRAGTDSRLNWFPTGSPYYRVFSSAVEGGPFDQLEGWSADTTFVDSGAVGSATKRFYQVVSSSAP